MSAPFTIRVSALSGYPDCPRRGAARLFREVIEAAGFTLRRTPRGIGAVIGTAVHSTAAVLFEEKARTGELPGPRFAIDRAVHELGPAGLDRGEVLFDPPRGVTHNRNEAEQQTSKMIRAYWFDVAPSVDPIMVEQRLEARISDDLILSGQPDLVAREPNAVRDLKTGARFGSHAPQIGGYSLLARSHGIEIAEARIDWLQRVSGDLQPDTVSVAMNLEIAESAASNIIRHIEADLRTFRQGDPERRILPADPWAFMSNPSSNLCSARWCPAYGTDFCREGAAAKGESHER